ncbi:tetratricopeptide repeat protein [Limibacter armeniacum]|uniref:tetratricopeptide repeat protein n=1 Tax=Limibacter armeniacum TaxID=466084 RepID=UPI002FE648B5
MSKRIISLIIGLLLSVSGIAQKQTAVDSLRHQLEVAVDDSVRALLLLDLSKLYLSNDFDKSLEYAEAALVLSKKIENLEMEGFANNKIAILLFQSGQHSKALDYFIKCRKIYEKLGDTSREIGQISNICIVHMQMKEYDKAAELSRYVISEQEKLLEKGDSSNINQVYKFYNNLGSISSEQKDFDKSKEYFLKALEIANTYDIDDLSGFSALYNNLADNALHMDNDKEAFEYLQKAKVHSKQTNNQLQLIESNLLLANYYLKKELPKEALKRAEDALSSADQIGALDHMESASYFLYTIYKELGRSDQALQAHENFLTYHDSIFNEQSIKEITRLHMLYDFEKKEEVAKAEQERTRLIYSIIIILLVFAVVITWLILWLNRSRAASTYFEKQSLEKDLELRQRELVMKEIYLLEKNAAMEGVVIQLSSLKEKVQPEDKEVLKQVIKDVNSSINKTVWEEFEVRYQKVHKGFYEKLREDFPDLTQGEEKLSALLRLGMSSKEIADITHQSVKSVEVARSRLRKKLKLTNTSTNLNTFLMEM